VQGRCTTGKINITTRSRNWERSMNLDLILEMFGKIIS
jgi:hypothetical protein